MRHLTTEELLRHFDRELIPQRAEHIDRCAFCQDAMVGLQALLYEVELELKRSVPAEPAVLREASLERLRGSMRPLPEVVGFPQWRRLAYGIAATILMAALAGYLALNSPPGAVQQAGGLSPDSGPRPAAELGAEPIAIPIAPIAAPSTHVPSPTPVAVASAAQPAQAAPAAAGEGGA